MGRNTQFLKEADRVISIGFFDRAIIRSGWVGLPGKLMCIYIGKLIDLVVLCKFSPAIIQQLDGILLWRGCSVKNLNPPRLAEGVNPFTWQNLYSRGVLSPLVSLLIAGC
jgi:hypothetical protein